MNAHIEISMLGEFVISSGKKILKDKGKTKKLWSMLGYLLANHSKTISQSDLIELLCNDDETPDPGKVVKNLAYRLRKMLSSSDLPDLEYIVQRGSAYSWNNSLNFSLDIEMFEDAIKKAKLDANNEMALENYIKAFSIYKGDFLPNFEYEIWTVDITTYYHRLFVEALHDFFKLAADMERYDCIIPICEKAIALDRYAEDIYLIYIKSLIKLNKHKEAMKQYEIITSCLYDELGVNPSNELKNIYREMTKTVKNVEMDLGLIKEGLNEEENPSESYYCDYPVFKDIYRFVARRIERTGEPFHLLLCTITDKKGELLEAKVQAQAMEEFKNAVATTLRKGDVFSRYSASQYVIMLPDISFENGRKVANRIKEAHKTAKTSSKVNVNYNLKPLDSKIMD